MYYQNYGLKYTVLRYPNVYGQRQDPLFEAGVVAIFTGQLLAGSQVEINGDGQQERDFVHVTDCVQANLLALPTNNIGAFNIGSLTCTTVNQIFFTLKEIIGYSREVVFGPPMVGETRRIFLNAGRSYAEPRWELKIELNEGLERTVLYFKRQKSAIRRIDSHDYRSNAAPR